MNAGKIDSVWKYLVFFKELTHSRCCAVINTRCITRVYAAPLPIEVENENITHYSVTIIFLDKAILK